MKTGISAAIRRFIEQNIVADDPFPERSWLDQQDRRRLDERSSSVMAGLPVEPLRPLPRRHTAHSDHSQRLRRRLRSHNSTTHHGEGI
ncbi:hypothetical protein [Arthrobacter sp. ISL-65]|uniref:hypothetical protein n=1 Tax=Arthrobacter sp. ISL-65 TaxID=2819112 RepID=UPI001BE5C6E2|nr:hypothetical protein [Arthrobacter sp. ISL-65]MBT2549608.1 hypothetical protein [Arthrobacter sp. ISL-65]